jgi:hypothetical protein
VIFGQEFVETLNVAVRGTGSPGSTPPGRQVTVREGTTTLCTISLVFQVGSCTLTDSPLTPGTHVLTAAYSGDGINTPSVSPPVNLTVLKGEPTIFLQLNPSGTVEYGGENAVDFIVTATPNGSVTPTGQVSAEQVGTNLEMCLANLAGSDRGICHLNPVQLEPGEYQVFGNYTGDSLYNGDTSAPQTFTVTDDGISVQEDVPASVFSDQEDAAELSYTISPDVILNGDPGGKVTFSAAGATLCVVGVLELAGSCHLTAGELPAGSYAVAAGYSGDGHYGSSFSGTASLVISDPPPPAAVPSTTSLKVSAPKATFGNEQTERLSVQVGAQPAVAGRVSSRATAASGKVTVTAGSTTVCVVTLAQGVGSCPVGASKLRPGKYQLTASYGGSSTFRTSVSGPVGLTVSAEPTATSLKLSAATVKAGHEGIETLSVQVAPKFSGTAAGKVTVKAGSVKLCVITLSAGKGSCKLTASQLKVGTYQVVAGYAAATPFAASDSAKKTLTVTKK